MFSLFTSRAVTLVNAAAPGAGAHVRPTDHSGAHQVLESADASAGRDPQRAQELREAARAFLSVVR